MKLHSQQNLVMDGPTVIAQVFVSERINPEMAAALARLFANAGELLDWLKWAERVIQHLEHPDEVREALKLGLAKVGSAIDGATWAGIGSEGKGDKE